MTTTTATWTWYDPNQPTVTNVNPFPFSVLYSSSAQGADQFTLQRNFQFELQAVPGAGPLLFEGMSQPIQEQLQGLILTQNQLQYMLYFYNLQYYTVLTDDRSFSRIIYPSQFQWTRIPSITYPWKSSFQLNFIVYMAASGSTLDITSPLSVA